MFSCPNCGAGMLYDIDSGKLKCAYCGTSRSVEDHMQPGKAAKQDIFTVKVFYCPHCGGEIRSANYTAADFCPYCRASVLMEGRLEEERRPQYIVPFRITKERCMEIFRRKAGRIRCLPKEYKKADYLQSFTGIYMPYWIYDTWQKDKPVLTGKREKGGYTEYCEVQIEVAKENAWIPFDAAAYFPDDLSSVTAPPYTENVRAFSAEYLSGFYVDQPDVSRYTYVEDACKEAYSRTMQTIQEKIGHIRYDEPLQGNEPFHPYVQNIKSALIPFWFLTWRKGDRVAYGAINGDSGDCSMDLPVSIPRFFLASILWAFPIACTLLILPTIPLSGTMYISMIIGMYVLERYSRITKDWIYRERHLTDKGFLTAFPEAREAESAEKKFSIDWIKEERERIHKGVMKVLLCGDMCLPQIVLGICFLLIAHGESDAVYAFAGKGIVFSVFAAIADTLSYGIEACLVSGKKMVLAELFLLSLPMIAAAALCLINPVQDHYYYAGIIILLLNLCLILVRIICRYNRLCTRPIPEYHLRRHP